MSSLSPPPSPDRIQPLSIFSAIGSPCPYFHATAPGQGLPCLPAVGAIGERDRTDRPACHHRTHRSGLRCAQAVTCKDQGGRICHRRSGNASGRFSYCVTGLRLRWEGCCMPGGCGAFLQAGLRKGEIHRPGRQGCRRGVEPGGESDRGSAI